VCALFAAAADWPQWRGPERTGRVDGGLPAQLPPQLERVWTVEVGEGHSSPVVAHEHGGDRVYQHARQGDDEVVMALDLATGRELWRTAFPTPYAMNPAATAHGKGPKSTPVIAGSRLCTLGIAGALTCLDRESGAVLWRHTFEGRFTTTAPDFGTAMSPMVLGDLLIAHVGGVESGALAAFRLEDGTQVWSWEGDGPGYASPIVATFGGGPPQLLTQSRAHLVGLDAESGRLLWRVPFETPYVQNIVTPVVFGDLAIFSGLMKGTTALRPKKGAGGDWTVEEAWRNGEISQYMTSPVLAEGLLFGLSPLKRGQLFCLDAATGRTLWTSEGRIGENASLVLAGDRLLVTTTDGVVYVAPATRDGFEPLARYEVASSPVWAHAALVEPGLLIKDRSSLTLWRF
jgi:outer membrane protein assembly factor BamB